MQEIEVLKERTLNQSIHERDEDARSDEEEGEGGEDNEGISVEIILDEENERHMATANNKTRGCAAVDKSGEFGSAKAQFLELQRAEKNVVSSKDVHHYIKGFVRSKIYPKMKFFRRSDMVASKSKVAQLVLDEVARIGRDKVQERDDWWNRNARIVRSTIDDRRSANSNSIKEVFMREYYYLRRLAGYHGLFDSLSTFSLYRTA